MTDTDASALRALREAELHALADIVLADLQNSDGSNETVLQMCGRIIAGGFRRDPDLPDELDRLRGQVARVEALHVPNSESWHPGAWCNECMQADHEGLTGCEYPCPTKQALAIPAERTGVSRESIEQVRWAEANPNAVALDEVEAKRRDTAEGGE